jgi:hypothetical protein
MSYIGNNVQPVNNFGESGGDFDGVSILDNVVKGNLALSTQSINNEARDLNNRIVISDSPREISLFASTVGQAFTIDTQGYQSIHVTTRAFAGGVAGSNDQVTYNAFFIVNPASYATTTTVAANTSYIVPCSARYVRFTATTAGSFVYTLRNTPPSIGAQNLALIGGAAVSATTAQLGMSLVNIGAAAQSSTNPLFVSPVALAATNNQTIGQSIITATAAAVVQAKATAGRLTMLNMQNNSANIGFLHLQNNGTATTSTASVQTYVIPPSIGSVVSVGLPDGGLYLSAGIAFTVSGAIASGDTTALTSPSMVVNYAFI